MEIFILVTERIEGLVELNFNRILIQVTEFKGAFLLIFKDIIFKDLIAIKTVNKNNILVSINLLAFNLGLNKPMVIDSLASRLALHVF